MMLDKGKDVIMMNAADYRIVQQPEGFYSVEPLPDPDLLAEFYAQEYYQDQHSSTYQSAYSTAEIDQRYLRSRLTVHAIDSCLDQASDSREFVDVGCGEGFLLKVAQDAGYHVKGIDLSEFAVQRFHPALANCVEIGDVSAILDRFLANDRKIDVCCMQNVLEHVIDPRTLIRQVRAVLSPRGLAVITVPNDFSRMQLTAEAQGLISRRYWLAPPQHLHYFNTESLPVFLGSLGFTPLLAFADFPIEFFLYHPGSNYIQEPTAGKPAHLARVQLELLMAGNGLAPLLELCRALTLCGMGRNVTIIARPTQDDVK